MTGLLLAAARKKIGSLTFSLPLFLSNPILTFFGAFLRSDLCCLLILPSLPLSLCRGHLRQSPACQGPPQCKHLRITANRPPLGSFKARGGKIGQLQIGASDGHWVIPDQPSHKRSNGHSDGQERGREKREREGRREREKEGALFQSIQINKLLSEKF